MSVLIRDVIYPSVRKAKARVNIDRRLSQQTRLLKERNQSLLRAVGTAKSNPNASGSSSGGGPE